jgi:hypothetical protein
VTANENKQRREWEHINPHALRQGKERGVGVAADVYMDGIIVNK